MLKRLICAVVTLLILAAWSEIVPLNPTFARDLSISLRTDPDRFVLEDSFLHAYVITNEPSWLTIELHMGQQEILWKDHVETTALLEKHLQIPVVYPLNEDFIIKIHAVSMISYSVSGVEQSFVIQKKVRGNLTLQGRVLECSPFHKIGLEGAMVEIISGPSFGREMTEDEGYFTFNQLPAGPYKLRFTHPCASQPLEKVIFLDEKTSFQELCLQTYRIPDMDLWLNKPSGSVFEVGETMTLHMRSSVAMKADLMITDFRETRPLFKGIQLREDEIQRIFWKPTLSQRLGKIELSLVPAEQNLCGEARYQFQLISNFQSGVIRGRVRLGGKPIPDAEVYLPLQSNEPVWTDERGYFEIPDVLPGIHVVRVRTSDEMYADRHGVEVSKGRLSDLIEIDLPNEEITFTLNPPEIHATTHERREKRIPLTISLSQGTIDHVRIQILEGPSELSVFPNTLPSLLKEKRRVWLVVSESCPIGNYPIKLRVGNELHSVEWTGMIQVTGLSRGTFDGVILPMQKISIQGETAEFVFQGEKFTNFDGLVSLEPVSLPPYTECITEDPQRVPSPIGFKIRTSMNTPPGQYTLWIKASGDGLSSWHSAQFEVLKAGGTLASVPEKIWNPILSSGQRLNSAISLWSPKGETRHVRLQLAFGPSWLRFENRNIGTVGEEPVEVPIIIQPSAQVMPGGYPYAINLIYGERSEGFFKLEGQIYILENQLDIPNNLRARHIREENHVLLTWGPPVERTEQIVGYNIYRSLRYPTLDYAVPLNDSVITERQYIDDDFLIGRAYWYVVRAVHTDGSLSPRSNTAEIRISPSDPFSAQIVFPKGEKATCFSGEQASVWVNPSHESHAEIWVRQGEWSVLAATYQLKAHQKQTLHFVIPDFEGESIIETLLVQNDGQKFQSQHQIFIRNNQKGTLTFKGKLTSAIDGSAITHARIWTWDGPTYQHGYSDQEGNIEFQNLSEGMYRWMIEYGGNKTLTEAGYVDAQSEKLQSLDLPLQQANPFYCWIVPLDEREVYGPGDAVSISVLSNSHCRVSYGIEIKGVQRYLLSSREITMKKVATEKLLLPMDLPDGLAYIVVESDDPSGIIRLPIMIEKRDECFQGLVSDSFGNLLQNVDVYNSDYSLLLASTNEWGYFYISSDDKVLNIQKQGYETININCMEQEAPFELIMPYALLYEASYSPSISVSDDFTVFEWWITLSKGWLPSTSTAIYSGIKPPVEEGLPEPEEAPWRKYHQMDLFPGHCYRLVSDGLPLSPDARLEWHDGTELHRISVHPGLSFRWYLEKLPEIPIFIPGTSDQLALDLYSFGYYRSIVRAEIESHTPGINAWLLPERYVSGQMMRMMLELPEDVLPGFHLFSLKLKLDDRTEIRNFAIYVRPVLPLDIEELYWQPLLYSNSTLEQRFYFSEGLVEPSSLPTFSEDIQVRFFNQYVLIKLSPAKAGNMKFEIPIFQSQRQIAQIFVRAQVMDKPSWKAPQIDAFSDRDGALIKLSYDSNPMYCKIFRSHRYQHPIPLHQGWIQEKDFLDQNAKERESYRYLALAIDGQLEASWSNEVDIIYRQLFIQLNFKDGYTTNRSDIEWKGSVSIGARLFINNQAVELDRHGVFARFFSLEEGANRFVFRVEDDSGNQLVEERTVYKDSQAPIIELVSPDQDLFHTLESEINLIVQTEPKAYLSANGILVKTDDQGIGSYLVSLQMGKNLINWIATDLAGNQSKLAVTIYRHRGKRWLKLQIGQNLAYIDDQQVILDSPPLVISGRTLVPLRFIAEAMGSKVDWIPEKKEILIRVGDKSIQLQIGVKQAVINQKEKVDLDVPPMIIQGRTLVPLRFIAEVLDGEVEWIAETKQIHVRVWIWES